MKVVKSRSAFDELKVEEKENININLISFKSLETKPKLTINLYFISFIYRCVFSGLFQGVEIF